MYLRGRLTTGVAASGPLVWQELLAMVTSVLDKNRRVLIQFAQANPRAGTSSLPLDSSLRPPVCLQAGACLVEAISVSTTASDTCAHHSRFDVCAVQVTQRVSHRTPHAKVFSKGDLCIDTFVDINAATQCDVPATAMFPQP